MVCYNHPEKPALGVCKHCQRGLCSECAAVTEDVLACKNRHEQEVLALEQLTARNIFQSKRVSSAYMRNAIFYGLVGLLFTGFGWYQYPFLGLQAVFFILIGLFLLYAAGANYFEARKHKG
jgi:sulfite exporter TauE/SafE